MAELPQWQPLADVDPPATDGSGRVVAVVASESAATSGWGPSAALDLARSWTGRSHRVLLVDGALEKPSLHRPAGLDNREGLADAALHGASISRVSHPMDDGAFFLVTAGLPLADPSSVARSGRWHRISEGVGETGVLLLLYLRDGQAGTPAFLGSASDIVVLSAPGEALPASIRDLTPLVHAVTGPEDPRSVPAGPGATEEVRSATPAAPKVFEEEERGMGRLLLLLLGALLLAAGLGYLLTSFL